MCTSTHDQCSAHATESAEGAMEGSGRNREFSIGIGFQVFFVTTESVQPSVTTEFQVMRQGLGAGAAECFAIERFGT